jgi:hypothetical protein
MTERSLSHATFVTERSYSAGRWDLGTGGSPDREACDSPAGGSRTRAMAGGQAGLGERTDSHA